MLNMRNPSLNEWAYDLYVNKPKYAGVGNFDGKSFVWAAEIGQQRNC